MIEIKFTGTDWHDISYQLDAFRDRMNRPPAQDSIGEETAVEEVAQETKPAVTLAEIQSLTKAKLGEKKSGAIKKLLAEFGVSKVGQVAEADYADFYARLEGL